MKKIKWKPVLLTREDGSNYIVNFEKPYDSNDIFRKIAEMPKQKPVSFEVGYQLLAEHTDALFDEENGGKKLAAFLNQHGFFPEGLQALGYHIELSRSDFEVVS